MTTARKTWPGLGVGMGLSEKLRTVRGRLYLGFALLLAMILLLAGVVTYESYRISSVNLERQAQASDLHRRVDEMEIDLLNMETGKRGYLLDDEELDAHTRPRKTAAHPRLASPV